MAYVLIKDRDAIHSDPEKDYRGCYKKGYIVETFEDSKPYETPAEPFVILVITDRTKAQIDQYMNQWVRTIDYNIIARDVVQDGWRLEIKTTNPNISGKGHLTQNMVENYINSWNGVVVNFINNGVRFDISIYLAATSERFWGRPVTPIIFNEVSYDQGTGAHRISADYGAVGVPQGMTLDKFEEMFARQVTEHGGTVVSNASGVITFDLPRDIVIQKFRDDVKQTVENTICRRKLYLDPSFVDQIIANGRVMITDAASVQGYIRDRLTE